jgi:hypothetical protein
MGGASRQPVQSGQCRQSAENPAHQGYNAYIRTSDGVNRVFVGPLIERAEADRLRDQLDKQQKLKGIVVRFSLSVNKGLSKRWRIGPGPS